MKRQIYYYISQIVALIVLIQIIEVNANGVAIGPIENPALRIFALTIMFIIGTSIEFGLFKLDIEKNQSRKQEFLMPVFKVNLVSYPFTQILAYIVYIYFLPFFWLYVLAIEIAVILIEWQLLRILLQKKNDHIPSRKILIQMIKVNFVSFLVGLIAFIPLEYAYFGY